MEIEENKVVKCKYHPEEILTIKDDNLFGIDQIKIDCDGYIKTADKTLVINAYTCPICGYCEFYKNIK